MDPMHAPDALTELRTAPPGADRDAFTAFVVSHGDAALWREGGSEHLTASCFVLSPDLSHVLLCLHRKGRFWVQFGGHLEHGDVSLADAARREAREESGVPDLDLATPRIVDLDRHDLHGGFACAAHWDVGFVAIARPDVATSVSDESDDVRWFPVDALPASLPPGFADRLAGVLVAFRARI
ncbi:NUDIX hydrolase [Curtobacterium sp. SL109]|uniref:NUDIX hydrolase n=1 Tax=Curtobacterium sp. SL109 TaxID=2994662 RepID=UPI002275DD18|nr:NUDIX domain-containing protein [Curtobacterium sp. SL109]MCY1695696.1 NUDIX domain-containing protein [Curtobacterium sp. SL109]